MHAAINNEEYFRVVFTLALQCGELDAKIDLISEEMKKTGMLELILSKHDCQQQLQARESDLNRLLSYRKIFVGSADIVQMAKYVRSHGRACSQMYMYAILCFKDMEYQEKLEGAIKAADETWSSCVKVAKQL